MRKLLLASLLLMLFACEVRDNKYEIDYLGENPPGTTAQLFSKGVVSTDSFEHSSPVFSRDGRVVLWNVVSRIKPAYLLEATYDDGEWSAPHRPSFSDSTADDFYPSFSNDGVTLYFSSRRNVPEDYHGNNMRIWKVERVEDHWGTPTPIDSTISRGTEYAHSITNDGKFYFSSSTDWNIHTGSETLPFGINSVNYEDGPLIAPDESFLIFESHRAEGIEGSIDLYISFKLDDNTWSLPVNMGPTINSEKSERMAKLSPDGKYLFFGSDRNLNPGAWGFDIYWISTKIIDELRNDSRAKTVIERPLADDLIYALVNNNYSESARLLKDWTSKYPDDLEGARTYTNILRKQRVDVALGKFANGKKDEAAAIMDSLLLISDDLEARYNQVINGLQAIALYDLADQYFEKYASRGIHPGHIYNRACFYSKLGEKERAFRYLNRAADNGYQGLSQYENDNDLISLKNDPRWAQLKKKLK